MEPEPELFALAGTGTAMHSGPGSGAGFGSEFNIKCNTKVKKLKKLNNERSTFWKTMLLLTVKRQYFVHISAKYGLDPVPDRDRDWERNKLLRFQNTD